MSVSALRRRGLAGVIVAGLASVSLGFGSVAAAAPVAPHAVTIKGSQHQVSSTSPNIAVDYSIHVGSGPLQNSVFVITLPPGVRVVAGSAKFDADAVRSTRIDTTASGARIAVGAGSTSRAGGTITAGAHQLRFVLDAKAAGKNTAVAATLDYASNEVPGSAKANPLALAVPDVVVKIPEFSGEYRNLPLQTGETGDFVVELSNVGAPTGAATLSIALPAGLTVDQDFGVQRGSGNKDPGELTCRAGSGHTVTCALGAVGATTQFVDIPLRATAAAPVGKVGRFTISAEADSGLDANPADNSVTGSVLFVGGAHLKVKITPLAKTVVVGHSVKLHLAVKNTGNLPATDVFGFVLVLDKLTSPRHKHFQITGFSGKVFDLNGNDVVGESGSGSANPASDSVSTVQVVAVSGSPQRTLARRSSAAAQRLPVIAWNVGTIAAGHTTRARLTVRATAVGSGVVAVAVFSFDVVTDDCTGPDLAGCDEFALAKLTAVARPARTPANGAANTLADTGTATRQLTALGLLALLVGMLLLWAGRRRQR